MPSYFYTSKHHGNIDKPIATLADVFLFIDTNGTIVYANEATSALLGVHSSHMLGHPFWQCDPHLASIDLYHAFIHAAFRHHQHQVEYYCPSTDVWLYIKLVPTSRGLVALCSKQPITSLPGD